MWENGEEEEEEEGGKMEGAAVEGANRPNKDSEVPLDFPESYISREKEREQ